MIVRLIGWHFKQFQYYTGYITCKGSNEGENITETSKCKQNKGKGNKQNKKLEEKKNKKNTQTVLLCKTSIEDCNLI